MVVAGIMYSDDFWGAGLSGVSLGNGFGQCSEVAVVVTD